MKNSIHSDYKNIITITLFFLISLLFQTDAFCISAKEAESLVNEGRYREALDMLNELNENTAETYYLKGLCLYSLNQGLDEAIMLLTKSLTANGPVRIKLILGLIYHKQYKTDEAVRMLKEFLSSSKEEADKETALRYLEYCQNINAVAHRGKISSVRGKTSILLKDIAVHYNQQDINGVIVPKSYNLNNKIDERNQGQNTMMVLPKDAENIDFVYFSSYEAGRPDHTDIFRVKVLENGEFSVPENLGSVINTKQDEMYPYFDQENQVLYFASKGHQSIGGYDIFMSYYNAGAESWSKPVNMGLPVNSSDDDFFYMPLTGDNEYIFSTNRHTGPGYCDIIWLNVAPGAGYKTLVKQSDIVAFNNFEENQLSAAVTNDIGPDLKNDPSYRSLLDKALNFQVKADSADRRIREQQQKIDVALSENRKIQLKTELTKMQEEYRKLKDQADLYYEAVREWERKNNLVTDDIPVTQEENKAVIQEIQKPEITQEKSETYEKPADTPSALIQKEYLTVDDLPDGVVFTIQIGVFSKKMEKENLSGLQEVFYYFIPDRNLYKYYTGVFKNLDEARARLTVAKGAGFSDAFIAAFYAHKPVSINQAQEILQNN